VCQSGSREDEERLHVVVVCVEGLKRD
jgi:hypothetical protein